MADLDPTKRERQLGLIRRAASQMTRLIEDLLDAARIRTGQLGVTPGALDPAELVREAATFHAPLADEKALTLVVDELPPLPTVRADRQRVLQVFSNLLGNAISFTPEGGRITLSASSATEGVVFTVQDTGPGIDGDKLGSVFERYWRAHPDGRKGAGLGLAIAKGIVEAHGGSIHVESAPGDGARFRFSLPVAPDSPADTVQDPQETT
jgi:signal transduction histidine kinase